MPAWGLLDQRPRGTGFSLSRYIVDNDVSTLVFQRLQGLGMSVVTLPFELRSKSDDDVLAEARRRDRVLITHDQRFVDLEQINPAENRGVIILPRDKRGDVDWDTFLPILECLVVSLKTLDQTATRILPSAHVKITRPNNYTGAAETIFCRLGESNHLEAWVDDDDEFVGTADYGQQSQWDASWRSKRS